MNCQTFECHHQKLNTSRSFYVSKCDTGIRRYHRILAVEKARLCTLEEYPLKILRNIENMLNASYFLMQPHTWNTYQEVPQWCKDACCSKSIQGILIQIIKVLSSVKLNILPHILPYIASLLHLYTNIPVWNLLTIVCCTCFYISDIHEFWNTLYNYIFLQSEPLSN